MVAKERICNLQESIASLAFHCAHCVNALRIGE
jgi:hypothetical protein